MAEVFFIDNEQLISLVEKQPAIWDRTNEFYKNRHATQAAWEDIIITMNPNIESKKVKTRLAYSRTVMQRWTHLRDNYNRALKRLHDYKTSKGGTKKPKPYFYDKQMRFLQKLDIYKFYDTVDNNTIDTSINENTRTESEYQDNDSKDDISLDTNSVQSDDIIVTTPKPESNRTDPVKRPLMDKEDSPLAAKMMKFMDPQSSNDSINRHQRPLTEKENALAAKVMKLVGPHSSDDSINRHLSFFHGILPSLDNLDENDVLEFQTQVLQLLKRIRNSRRNSGIVD